MRNCPKRHWQKYKPATKQFVWQGITNSYLPVQKSVRMPVEKAARMRAGGAQFHDWFAPQKDGTVVTRIALAFATPDEHVAKLIELAKA